MSYPRIRACNVTLPSSACLLAPWNNFLAGVPCHFKAVFFSYFVITALSLAALAESFPDVLDQL